jgi:hypothetical protein
MLIKNIGDAYATQSTQLECPRLPPQMQKVFGEGHFVRYRRRMLIKNIGDAYATQGTQLDW